MQQHRRPFVLKMLNVGLHGMTNVVKLFQSHDITVEKNIPYVDNANTADLAHCLDIYLPKGMTHTQLQPVVMYVHGGGFNLFSKETHWLLALNFARQGYLVVNINYRLSPEHPFPAGLQDVFTAWEWIVKHIGTWGGDPQRIILAGESAGANLVTSLALSIAYQRPEPYAQRVFAFAKAHNLVPLAVLAACGFFQVSYPGRFKARKSGLPNWLHQRIVSIASMYLDNTVQQDSLSDPLLILEQGIKPQRALPPFFLSIGTRDPLLDDTRRLDKAMHHLGVNVETRYYPGGIHAFHALPWDPLAKDCWADIFAFLQQHL